MRMLVMLLGTNEAQCIISRVGGGLGSEDAVGPGEGSVHLKKLNLEISVSPLS
jgi:hypothetical protein